MSLLLRKDCQTVLNTFGLNNYHADINSNNYLVIAGECSKPLVTISGISFSRKNPTAKEIEYAVELLNDFLTTHIVEIKNYIVEKKKLDNLPLSNKVDSDCSIYSNNIYIYLTIEENNIKYTFYISEKISDEVLIDLECKNITNIMDIKYISNIKITEINKALKQKYIYKKQERKINNLLNKLSSCNI